MTNSTGTNAVAGVSAAVQAFEAAMNKVPTGNPYEDCRRLRIEGTKLLGALSCIEAGPGEVSVDQLADEIADAVLGNPSLELMSKEERDQLASDIQIEAVRCLRAALPPIGVEAEPVVGKFVAQKSAIDALNDAYDDAADALANQGGGK